MTKPSPPAQTHQSEGVLKAHARSHSGYGLVSARLMLALHTPDVADAARAMQKHEDAFASAWVDAIADAGFKPELRHSQREALRALRTSTRTIYLVTHPAGLQLDDVSARALGKAWNKLDELARRLGVEPLSAYIALPGEGDSAGVPAHQLLPTLATLIDAVQGLGQKLPSKRCRPRRPDRRSRRLAEAQRAGWARVLRSGHMSRHVTNEKAGESTMHIEQFMQGYQQA